MKLRKRIEGFCYDWRKGKVNIAKETLTDEEWDHLQLVFDGLAPFKEATLAVEGRGRKGQHGAIWEWLPIVEALLLKLQTAVAEREALHLRNDPILVANQCAWNKLKDYYADSDDSHGIYGAAVLLHPTYRKRYFDRFWTREDQLPWIPVLLNAVKSKWQKEYNEVEAAVATTEVTTAPEPSILTTYLQLLEGNTTQDNAFDTFIYGTPIFVDNDIGPIAWWSDRYNVHPKLRQLALDLLAIPATSAEVERVFSSAKQLLTPRRNRMKEDTIEMLELMKYWWQRGIIAE